MAAEPGKSPPQTEQQAQREARLAKALRANLKRRKAQGQGQTSKNQQSRQGKEAKDTTRNG